MGCFERVHGWRSLALFLRENPALRGVNSVFGLFLAFEGKPVMVSIGMGYFKGEFERLEFSLPLSKDKRPRGGS